MEVFATGSVFFYPPRVAMVGEIKTEVRLCAFANRRILGEEAEWKRS